MKILYQKKYMKLYRMAEKLNSAQIMNETFLIILVLKHREKAYLINISEKLLKNSTYDNAVTGL